MKKGLVLGRFQPFHYGHLNLIKNIVEMSIEPLICVGSAQCSHTAENPFSIDERKEMIEAAMKDIECKYYLFGIPDINNFDCMYHI